MYHIEVVQNEMEIDIVEKGIDSEIRQRIINTLIHIIENEILPQCEDMYDDIDNLIDEFRQKVNLLK